MTENSIQEKGVVFISGAGLASWIWDDVTSGLAAPHITIDFHTLRHDKPEATLVEYVADAMAQINQLQTAQVVVVAHSLGGAIGVEVVKALKTRAAGFVAVCASVPLPGQSYASTLPFPQKLIIPVILKLAGTKPPESAIRAGLGDGLNEELVTKIVETSEKESVRVYTDKTTKDVVPPVPMAYVKTSHDKEFPEAMQNAMIKNLSTPEVITVAGGHMPMLSNAAEVRTIIERIAAQ